MKQSKLLALITAMVLAASSIAGCGGAASSQAPSGSESPAAPSESASASAEAPAQAKDLQADIVVIGAGGAGMTAAIQASEDGATNVVVLEKMAQTGGNTVRSTGGLNACETSVQKAANIQDSVALMVEDTMKGGKELNNKDLVTIMAQNSAGAVDWVNAHGGDLTEVGRAGGASVDRIHRPKGGSAVGPMLVKTLNDNLAKLNIPVLLETTATEILVDADGKVAGVKATGKDGEMTISCKAVVLAAGGFGANPEMVVKYKPELAGFATTNHAGATGDGIVMAEQLGLAFVDMEQIQTHPTVNPETTDMYTEGVRGNGAILINKDGKRFVNELETRDVVSKAILEQKDSVCYLVFDQKVRDGLKAIESYVKAGIITEADTVEELATKLSIDPAAMKASMDAYTKAQAAGTDAEFSRADMKEPLTTAKFYAGLCAPAIHHTMGGVKIDTACQTFKADGTPVPGLYAAGEITGGVHGGNRLGGTAVTDIVVFGRIAGTGAATYVKDNGGFTQPTITVAADDAAAVPEVAGGYKDGTYTGTGKGNNGDITVEVTVAGGNITAVKLTNHTETAGIYEGAEKGVVNAIIQKQTAEVDTVSGATNTSNGIKEAVTAALKDAK